MADNFHTVQELEVGGRGTEPGDYVSSHPYTWPKFDIGKSDVKQKA
jgi:hypothetical protein